MVSNFRTNFVIDSWEDKEGEEIKIVQVRDHTDINTEFNDPSYVLTSSETEIIKSAFNRFDKNKSGFVPIDCVPKIFVLAGQNPSLNIENMMQEKLNKGYGVAFYNDILTIFARYWKSPEHQTKELKNALSYIYDTSNQLDKMNVNDLTKFLCTYGERLQKDEIKQFQSTFDVIKQKSISATTFMKIVLGNNYDPAADFDVYKKQVTGKSGPKTGSTLKEKSLKKKKSTMNLIKSKEPK